MSDLSGSGFVQNRTSGLGMCNVWEIVLSVLYCSGDLNEELEREGGLWQKAFAV